MLNFASKTLFRARFVESARKPRPKYAVIIPDGAADEPLDELGGQIPLEPTDMESLHSLAGLGSMGTTNNLPEGLPAGSDVALTSILGYDPHLLPRAVARAAEPQPMARRPPVKAEQA
jgi:hypothetical protein